LRKKKKKQPFLIEKIRIEGVAAEGKCLARHDGKVVFFAGSAVAPGDVVDAEVYKQKHNYLEARPVHFHEYAQQRQAPFCSHFGVCGGCKWQHLPYEVQLAYKQQQVIDNLTKIGKLDLPPIRPILPASPTQYYRNKLEFSFSDRAWLSNEALAAIGGDPALSPPALGFHVPLFYDRILDIDHCYLQPDPSNAIRLGIKAFAQAQGWAFFNPKSQEGFLRNMVIRTTQTGQVMLIVIFRQDQPQDIERLLRWVADTFPAITCLGYSVNEKRNDDFYDLDIVHFSGKPYITEQLPAPVGKALDFQISPQSFFQTNTQQAAKLYAAAFELAALQGNETVFDLYCGAGTISLYMARQAGQVIGIEYVAKAVENAHINAQLNQIDNVAFYAGDMRLVLQSPFLDTLPKPDVVITDPPRAGMHPDVVQTLAALAPPKIVYVSCNPATQARDLALLKDQYRVVAVQPVDMFPHTHHVENIVRLDKIENR
jgi:23S rRNA (uracil1939-C5)-methyltransferase